MASIAFEDLLAAVEHMTVGGDAGLVEAWVCIDSGRLLYRDDASHRELYWGGSDDRDGIPEDPDGMEQFVPVPSRRDLDLGRTLALRFARAHLPDDYDIVDAAFRAPGAYSRFKHVLERRGQLQQWYDYDRAAVERELRDWCEAVGLELSVEPPTAEPK